MGRDKGFSRWRVHWRAFGKSGYWYPRGLNLTTCFLTLKDVNQKGQNSAEKLVLRQNFAFNMLESDLTSILIETLLSILCHI